LGVAYVVVPYSLGVLVAQASLDVGDTIVIGALYCLFIARINLKDFRDRPGDALHGKPTLLLRIGKRTTCLVSLSFLVAGDLLLIISLEGSPGVAAMLQIPVILIMYALRWLYRVSDVRLEQVAIGAGAKAGNGMLLAFLSHLILVDRAASGPDRLVFVGVVVAAFSLAFVAIASRPEDVAIAYKG
jgi:4-hydroxybenzoate polyprenyltransferase